MRERETTAVSIGEIPQLLVLTFICCVLRVAVVSVTCVPLCGLHFPNKHSHSCTSDIISMTYSK